MKFYTAHHNLLINSQINLKVQLISDTILKYIPCVKSIILTGGFGKGEGSIEISRDGKVAFLHDIDLAVIVDQIPKKEILYKFYNRVYSSLGVTNQEQTLFRASDFFVDIKFLRKKDLIYPDIYFYDLKVASELLFGEDVRDLVHWDEKDIPLSSGLRILFERVAALLGNFSYSYLNGIEFAEQKKKMLIFECYKIFIEICTTLHILVGKYKPKYSDRAINLGKFYQNELAELAQDLPNLPKKVKMYTDFKLKPDFNNMYEDPIELWFSARDYLGITLRFFLRKYLDIILSDWEDLPNNMKIVARHYYKSFLSSLLRAKLGSTNKSILDITNILYQILTNIEYTYVVSKDHGRPYLNPLKRFYVSPSLKFFPAGILLLFSLNRDGTIKLEDLRKAVKEFHNCIPTKFSTSNESKWEHSRKTFLKAYNLYRGHHFVK